ncbi:MAG: VWA domain-containing protein, partial [Planctomycetes bacterium]|nr:VWA domain-containing protein [Planctomycetota bacterium]
MRASARSLSSLLFAASLAGPALAQVEPRVPGGALQILSPDGKSLGACPLKHTEVAADIVGFVGRVTVRQIFHNPTDRKIEAVYVFPLPHDAAVDDMVMTVGDRRIVGQIKPRDEAREVYEAAKAAGHVASLLDQERPNIFTQSVANIEPGVEVVIEISYVETLKYEDGRFEWVFPMVVGPRYIPGGGSAPAPMTKGRDTPQVPDGSKITPPVTPKGTRAGHDISITVHLDAGMALHDLESELHDVDVNLINPSQAVVSLKNQAEIPNTDFILHYRLATDTIGDAFLLHEDGRGRFFTLILQPPKRVVPAQLVPRELVFVLDTSGSMSGYPIATAKKVMARTIDTMRAGDTFNLITFAGHTRILWDTPRSATPENIAEAQAFLASRQGGGGTEMMKAIDAALRPSDRVTNRALTPAELFALPTDGREVTLRVPPNMTQVLMQTGIAPGVVEVLVPARQRKTFRMQIRHWIVMRSAYDAESDAEGEFRGRWTTTKDGKPMLAVGDARWPAPWCEYLTPAELLGTPADGGEVLVRFEYNTWPAQPDEDGYAKAEVDGRELTVAREIPTWRRGATCPVGEPTWIWGTWKTLDDGRKALIPSSARHGSAFPAPPPIRVVCFMTDGYVGNDMAIIDAVKKNAGTTRVFSFGVGNSVNRFLLDGMAHAGRGEVEYVTLESQGDAAAERFHERILAPVLTDVEIDWQSLPVADVYPKRIPDLFSAKPILIHGRLTGPASGRIILRGNTGAGPYGEWIEVTQPESPPDHSALASLWARARVKHLMNQDLAAMQSGRFPEDLKKEITNLGVEFRLMTQFTSFVAVEEITVTIGGEAVRVDVLVEMPAGVDYDGVFGDRLSRGGGFAGKQASLGLRIRKFSPRRGVSSNQSLQLARRVPAANKPASAPADAEELDRLEDRGAEKTPAERAAEAWKQKLTAGLRGLGEKVRKEGKNGNFNAAELHVKDYRISVTIHLRDTSEGVLESLEQLGFVLAGESKA